MNELCLQIITFLHIIFVLFIILAPFSNIKYLLVLHAVVVPFMIIHWIANNNLCVLTLIEKHIRTQLYGSEQKNNDCFTCNLIEPVFDFTNDKGSSTLFIYLVTFGLWGITLYNLYYKFHSGEIKSFYELFN
jgi:hypothetical protein